LLVRLNNKPFRKREGIPGQACSPSSNQPALRPLPAERYETRPVRKLQVELDLPRPAEGHFYSVPYQKLVGQE